MARLVIIKGLNAGVAYDLGDRTRIGRLGENEIQVPDPNVSRLHAEIVNEGNSFTVFDRGSKNGVLINGQEIAETALKAGDEIVIGGSIFVFEPDFEIHNARFSNNSVFFLNSLTEPPKNQVISLKDDTAEGSLDLKAAVAISEIFGGAPMPLPALANKISLGLQQYFEANGVVVFVTDSPDPALRPIDVVPFGETVYLNGALITQCVADKTALSAVETISAPAAIATSSSASSENEKNKEDTGKRALQKATGSGSKKQPVTAATMIAPMLEGDNVAGALVVVREGDKPYTREQLVVLQAMAALCYHSIESARATERARNSSRAISALEAEQRSASTRSLRMQEIYNSAKRSADSAGTVLITGESGTGKETLARYIHESGSRASGPFIVVNCASIPPEQFEHELYGSETINDDGTSVIIPGRVEEAQGGTVFLYEIGELELSLQPKLLRFIQDRAFYRQGGQRAIQANIRIVASATVDLAAAVRAGKFREDLWYRLNVVPFHMPPLRERREDIGPLVDFFITRQSSQLSRKVLGANDSAIALLQKYDWPGNIRELNNAIERAVLLSDAKVLSTGDFAFIEEARRKINSHADLERKRDTKPLAEVERQHIMIALKKHNFNQARAAEALGLHRNTLRNKIIEYGIEIAK